MNLRFITRPGWYFIRLFCYTLMGSGKCCRQGRAEGYTKGQALQQRHQSDAHSLGVGQAELNLATIPRLAHGRSYVTAGGCVATGWFKFRSKTHLWSEAHAVC